MSIKYLDSLKTHNDKDLFLIINDSYNYYINNADINDSIRQDDSKKKAFSTLLRFYRSINSNKKIDEETFNQPIKELLKNKETSINQLIDKINQIVSKQLQRHKFVEQSPTPLLKLVPSPTAYMDDLLCNIKSFSSLSWRLNIAISNNYSNRVNFIYVGSYTRDCAFY